MYSNRIILTKKDILEKEFKIDTRGFRPQEVDKFLDVVIKDYETFNEIINDLESESKELLEENLKLKQEVRSFRIKLETIKENPTHEVTNSDLLRRLSNLEKIIYGKDE